MRNLCGLVVAGALAISLVNISPAAAATEFGDNCVADEGVDKTEVTVFGLTAPGNPLPLTAPSSGVITEWKMSQSASPAAVPQALTVARLNGPLAFIVGLDGEVVNLGANSFDARIPVQAGDRIGLFGSKPTGPLICRTSGITTSVAVFEGTAPPGSTVPLITTNEAEARIPVAAVLEADSDGDGFGDETQDACPQIVTTQTPCPVMGLDASSVVKRRTSVVISVTTTLAAPVSVVGTVMVGKGKKVKLSSPTQTVAPGKISKFTLKFPKRLKTKLKDLPRKRSLRLTVTASATDLIGRVSSDLLSAKLKGQEKKMKSRAS